MQLSILHERYTDGGHSEFNAIIFFFIQTRIDTEKSLISFDRENVPSSIKYLAFAMQ